MQVQFLVDEKFKEQYMIIIKDIEKFASNIESEILFDFEIKNLNWFNIGGKTKVFFKPKTLKDLVEFLKIILSQK